MVTYDRETTKFFLEENLSGFQQRGGPTHGDYIFGHDLPHAQLVQEVGQLMLSHVWCVGGPGPADIAVRDDANEDLLIRDDWQVTNSFSAHGHYLVSCT